MSRLRRVAAVLASILVVAPAALSSASAAEGLPDSAGIYVVVLSDPPRPDSPSWTRRITTEQDALLERVGGPDVLYRLTSALNGFVADLTIEQVKRLRDAREVDLVERSTLQHVDTVASPDALGVEEAWASAGGPDRAGRGTVVAVVDSGIWPENPSFAALPDVGTAVPAGFTGGCVGADHWEAADCNSKVVSARYFVRGFGEGNLAASEYLSPRDGMGHGSQTAAIAAGNDAVRVQVDGEDAGRAAGMAPGARIAVYKACWAAPDPDDDGCTTADAVAAIDRAVADGVDVISYSVSGPSGAVADSVERAFLNATAAGVFVATSAGNDGPAAGSVAHASPWVSTVGASTHRTLQGALVLGDGTRLVGAMSSDDRVPTARLLIAEDAAAPGADPDDARLCVPGSLSTDAQGAVVVCERGSIARVEKSAAVDLAGGVAMVLANVRPDTVRADFHAVPTVHLDVSAAERVKAYVRSGGEATASVDPVASDGSLVPSVAHFSSRGPTNGADVLKPDLTAPGVEVLAAVASPSGFGRKWDLSSGTSLSAAHVAGIAALVRAERPSWTPAMVRSALATTAEPLVGRPGPPAVGSGQVDAAAALTPGFVFDARTRVFRDFLRDRVAGSDLNLPSIAVGELTGERRLVRRVTNVSGGAETYTPRVVGLDGVEVAVRPRSLRLAPGETRRFAVTITPTGAELDTPAHGAVVWRGARHRARVPVVVVPRAVSADDNVSGSAPSGGVTVRGTAGTGRLDLSMSGLTAAAPLGLTLEPGAFDPARPTDDLDTARFPVRVPGDTDSLRLELEGHDADDLDLFLYREGDLVGSAEGSRADEVLTLLDPEPGAYDLFVHSAAAANGSTTTAQLYRWVVRERDAGNVSFPRSLATTPGERFAVRLSWRELDLTSRWLGVLRFADSDERTLVSVG